MRRQKMADAVASQTLLDGPGLCVIKCTNVSDGTGESAVVKVDVSGLTPAPSRVSIKRIVASTSGMGVRILWDATTDVVCFLVAQDQTIDLTFDPPLVNNSGDGITGDVSFTTIGHTSGDTYTIILYCGKS